MEITNEEETLQAIRTAVSRLNEIEKKLLYMRELSSMSADARITDEDRKNLDAEFQQLKTEIDKIALANKTIQGASSGPTPPEPTPTITTG